MALPPRAALLRRGVTQTRHRQTSNVNGEISGQGWAPSGAVQHCIAKTYLRPSLFLLILNEVCGVPLAHAPCEPSSNDQRSALLTSPIQG